VHYQGWHELVAVTNLVSPLCRAPCLPSTLRLTGLAASLQPRRPAGSRLARSCSAATFLNASALLRACL